MSKLGMLDVWVNAVSSFFAPKSAHGYMQPAMAMVGAGSCSGSCSTGDEKKVEEKPASCSGSCSAGDEKKVEEKPASCSGSCSAGDEKKVEEAPASCSGSCSAGDGK